MIKLRARRRHYGKADEIAATVAYLAAAVAARPPAGRLSPGRNPGSTRIERIVTMTTANRALVLSGGGAAGGAWMLALGPATIHLVVADEQSLAAIGPDAASAATAQAALDAGAAQARREISTLKAVWHSRAPGSDQSRRSD